MASAIERPGFDASQVCTRPLICSSPANSSPRPTRQLDHDDSLAAEFMLAVEHASTGACQSTGSDRQLGPWTQGGISAEGMESRHNLYRSPRPSRYIRLYGITRVLQAGPASSLVSSWECSTCFAVDAEEAVAGDDGELRVRTHQQLQAGRVQPVQRLQGVYDKLLMIFTTRERYHRKQHGSLLSELLISGIRFTADGGVRAVTRQREVAQVLRWRRARLARPATPDARNEYRHAVRQARGAGRCAWGRMGFPFPAILQLYCRAAASSASSQQLQKHIVRVSCVVKNRQRQRARNSCYPARLAVCTTYEDRKAHALPRYRCRTHSSGCSCTPLAKASRAWCCQLAVRTQLRSAARRARHTPEEVSAPAHAEPHSSGCSFAARAHATAI